MSERLASGFGVGMTLSPDTREVSILLVVGDGEDSQVFVPLDRADTIHLVETLQRMLNEMDVLNEAILTLPADAAQAYVENWIAREQN